MLRSLVTRICNVFRLKRENEGIGNDAKDAPDIPGKAEKSTSGFTTNALEDQKAMMEARRSAVSKRLSWLFVLVKKTLPPDVIFTKGDLWRFSAKAIEETDDDLLSGFFVAMDRVSEIPDGITDSLVNSVQRCARSIIMPVPTRQDLEYVSYKDQTWGQRWGICYVLMPYEATQEEAARHNGTVVRCALCANAPLYAASNRFALPDRFYSDRQALSELKAGIIECSAFGPAGPRSVFVCKTCREQKFRSLIGDLPLESYLNCWCGFRYLQYHVEKERPEAGKKCPNCGLTFMGSGVVSGGGRDIEGATYL